MLLNYKIHVIIYVEIENLQLRYFFETSLLHTLDIITIITK